MNRLKLKRAAECCQALRQQAIDKTFSEYGFKNVVEGDIQVSIDGVIASSEAFCETAGHLYRFIRTDCGDVECQKDGRFMGMLPLEESGGEVGIDNASVNLSPLRHEIWAPENDSGTEQSAGMVTDGFKAAGEIHATAYLMMNPQALARKAESRLKTPTKPDSRQLRV